MQGNQSFYNAWHTIYKRDPEGFSDLQDLYAKQQYYDTAETYLKQNGIDVSNRPDVVKGAIFSYSIQHGQVTAAQQIASVVNNQMSDRAFINAIYDKRSASYPAYVNRYNQERNDALALL